MDDLPVQTGSYTLVLSLAAPCRVQPGRLGAHWLPAGLYAYQGSAGGPGGLRARLGRHLRGGERSHWHIDYLWNITEVVGYACTPSLLHPVMGIPVECAWSLALCSLPGAAVPIPGFGAGDCRSGCPAHLVRIARVPGLDDALRKCISAILSADVMLLTKL
jgi:Uri superfamily endonuclease